MQKGSRSRGTSTQYMCVRLTLRVPTQLRNGNWRQVIAWHLFFRVALQSEQLQPSTATDGTASVSEAGIDLNTVWMCVWEKIRSDKQHPPRRAIYRRM
jgi:hypothetical protein